MLRIAKKASFQIATIRPETVKQPVAIGEIRSAGNFRLALRRDAG